MTLAMLDCTLPQSAFKHQLDEHIYYTGSAKILELEALKVNSKARQAALLHAARGCAAGRDTTVGSSPMKLISPSLKPGNESSTCGPAKKASYAN